MLYQDINTIVVKTNSELSAAEAQGMAAGMLCVKSGTQTEFWLQEILQDDHKATEDDIALLANLFAETRSLLCSDEFEFDLLLPDEDCSFSEQVDALGQWCQGFLYGLGSATTTSSWSEEVREIVKDIAECTKLEVGEEDEDAENDIMEITEYLRAAVIFLRTELNIDTSDTIH